MTRALSNLALAAAVAGCTTTSGFAISSGSRELQPLDWGWEQYFSVTWDASQRHGRAEVEGYVGNTSPYDITNVRVLVDSLDANGHLVAQQIGWVPGELRGGSHRYFEVPVAPAAAYRVRVFSYDRIEAAGVMSLLR